MKLSHLIQLTNDSCMYGSYQVIKMSWFSVAHCNVMIFKREIKLHFVVSDQPHVICPNQIAMVYKNWATFIRYVYFPCKLNGYNMFSFELDMPLKYFILFYWIKSHLWAVVSSWILLLETRRRHSVNADVADVPRFYNPCQLKTLFIAETLVRNAYNFTCKSY